MDFSEIEVYPPAELLIKRSNVCDQGGVGVVSTHPVSSGLKYQLKGQIVNDITQHTVEINPNLHFLDTQFTGYILHSCQPNAQLDMKNLTLDILRDIGIGEFLTIDYAKTESKLFRQFACSCHAPTCRRWIKGNSEVISEKGSAFIKSLSRVYP